MKNVTEIMHEIHNGYDGVIRSLSILSFKEIRITLEVQHAHVGWCNLNILARDVKSFRFERTDKHTPVVLSDGFVCRKENDIYYFNFYPTSDFCNVNDLQNSLAWFSAMSVEWDIEVIKKLNEPIHPLEQTKEQERSQ